MQLNSYQILYIIFWIIIIKCYVSFNSAIQSEILALNAFECIWMPIKVPSISCFLCK